MVACNGLICVTFMVSAPINVAQEPVMLSLALVLGCPYGQICSPWSWPWPCALSPCQVLANIDMLFPNTQNGWGGHSTEMATVLCIFHSQQR